MARWAVCWLLLIATATAGTYWWTSSLVATRSLDSVSFAMLPLGDLGSPVCKDATRALVAAGDGASPDATTDQQAAYEHAARAVLLACGSA